MHVIPSIDLRNGRCVRLRQGDFDAQTDYAVDPLVQARRYAAAGFSWLHVVDLDGCLAGQPVNSEVISAIAGIDGLQVQLGGGIRNKPAMLACLEAGVQRVVIGSKAFESPEDVVVWSKELGGSRIVVAADVRIDNGVPQPVVNGWRSDAGTGLYATLDYFAENDINDILCTDVSRDGMMAGPNLSFYASLCQRYPGMSLQASGGVRGQDDLHALQEAGVTAAIVGKSLFDGVMQPEEIRQWSLAG